MKTQTILFIFSNDFKFGDCFSTKQLWEDMILIDDVPIEQDLFLIWSRFLLEVLHVSFWKCQPR